MVSLFTFIMSLLVFLIIIIGLYFFGLGFFNVVKKLMKKNPENVKATNVDGWTPIHFAANNGIYWFICLFTKLISRKK